ncbi:kinetochore-associated protein KNL-2 homolog isoform X2 [Benincasa hispida]|uniref:kinetochore-associated protein KNL-2 homolog isoform X2 n=1 Tax=Benincasa hispida TaxID=102211 RepID=UPI0019009253|nr:kinetochore-associated protein KNL-2 homolog isoform X2 [Benincasa hispida]
MERINLQIFETINMTSSYKAFPRVVPSSSPQKKIQNFPKKKPNASNFSFKIFLEFRKRSWLLLQNSMNQQPPTAAALQFLTSRKQGQPVRIFSSAPIVKRYDVFTLETADGICVILKGFINKLRTADNGFTPQVFKHFVFGFPPNWENHAANCFEGEASKSIAAGGNISDTDNSPCTSKNADMNNCTLTNMSSPLCEISPSHGWDHGDSVAEDKMQRTSATDIPAPFTVADIQNEVENKGTKETESRKKVEKKIIFDSPGSSGISMNTRGRKEKKCIISPECRSYGRSRSGRLLLPTMEFWRNQLPVYDSDRKLRWIQEERQDIQPKPPSQPRGRKSTGGRKRKDS